MNKIRGETVKGSGETAEATCGTVHWTDMGFCDGSKMNGKAFGREGTFWQYKLKEYANTN